MKDTAELATVAEDGVRRATRAGAHHAEVYLWSARYHHAKLGGTLSSVLQADTSGLSVRVAIDDRLAFAVTSGISEDDVDWAITRAVRSARLLPRGAATTGFPPPAATTGGETRVHPKIVDPSPDRLLALVDTLDDAVAGVDAVDYAEATTTSTHGRFCVANSAGLVAGDANAYESVVYEVRCKGETHKFAKTGAFARSPLDEGEDLVARCRSLVDLAASSTRPKPLDGPVTRAIFDGVAAKEILHRVMAAFDGRAVLQGRSRLKDRLGERVAHESLTFRDLPNDGVGCRNQRVDDEGVPTRDLTLLDRGVVSSFLYDWRTAAEASVPPTGSGLRSLDGRYASMPSPGIVNLDVRPGDQTLDEMVEGADRAVLIRGSVLGSFTMNPTTGDFSFVVPMAHLIEKGRIRHALPSGTAAGNLFDCIRQVEGLGREVTRLAGGTSVPLAVAGVTFAT